MPGSGGLGEAFESLVDFAYAFELIVLAEDTPVFAVVVGCEFADLHVLPEVFLLGLEELLRALVFVLLEDLLVLLEEAVEFDLLHLECLDVVAQGFDGVALLGHTRLQLALLLGLLAELTQLLL